MFHSVQHDKKIVKNTFETASSFTNEGFENCRDQFMLGDKYLVAPVLTKENTRIVKLPKRQWSDDEGETYKGGKEYTFKDIPLERLPWFEKIK